jgi:hypothetical protein
MEENQERYMAASILVKACAFLFEIYFARCYETLQLIPEIGNAI